MVYESKHFEIGLDTENILIGRQAIIDQVTGVQRRSGKETGIGTPVKHLNTAVSVGFKTR